MARHPFRSVFISDVHLGLADCQARYLLGFLRSMQCEHLYLVGDIIDFENMALHPYWHADHGDVVTEILAIAARGTRVTYIPGNHDANVRRFAGQRIGGVEIALAAVHVGADGRRYRVSHGDEFDGEHDASPWLLRLGDALQGLVCSGNRRINALRRQFGFGYVPLSIRIKQAVARARRFIEDFESRVASDARRAGFDGHICGHIHYGRIADRDGVLYVNDGDWVEHCTALVEHADGALELLHWSGQAQSLAHSPALPALAMELPAAA